MTSQLTTKRRLSRNTLYLIMIVYIAVVVLVWSWESYLAAILILAGAGSSGYLILRDRRSLGRYAISTECESCGSMLQEHTGIPEAVCRSCGRKQSWAK